MQLAVGNKCARVCVCRCAGRHVHMQMTCSFSHTWWVTASLTGLTMVLRTCPDRGPQFQLAPSSPQVSEVKGEEGTPPSAYVAGFWENPPRPAASVGTAFCSWGCAEDPLSSADVPSLPAPPGCALSTLLTVGSTCLFIALHTCQSRKCLLNE